MSGDGSSSVERRRALTLPLGGLVVLAWIAAAVGAFFLRDVAEMRFLDLPLSAYLAGQGAIMAVAVVAFQVSTPTER